MKTIASDESIKRYLEKYYFDKDCDLNEDTVKRYKTIARKRMPDWFKAMETSYSLREKYSESEIGIILRGERIYPKQTKHISFKGDKFKFAFITDTHFGADCFDEGVWNSIVEEINNSDVDFVVHTGDIVNGFDRKKEDLVFKMTHISYDSQKEYAVKLLGQIKKPIYGISGNHDRFFFKNCGAKIVKDIGNELDNFCYLGEDTADLTIDAEFMNRGNKNYKPIVIRLWHGEDGGGRITSSRPQNLLESFSVSDYPDVLLCGHTHKQCFLFEKGVHIVSGGAVCGQSDFMKRKKLANHQGFHIIEIEHNERGITKFTPTWYPVYDNELMMGTDE